MDKRQLLKKVAKGASVALLAGAMVCGASLTSANAAKNNKSAAYEEQGFKKGQYNGHNLGATRKTVKHAKKGARKSTKRTKNIKKAAKKSKKNSKKAANKKSAKKATRKGGKKAASKKSNKESAKKGSKLVKKGTKKAFNKRNRKASKKSVKSNHKAKKATSKKSSKKATKKASNKRGHKVSKKSVKKNTRNTAAKRAALKHAKRVAHRNAVKEPLNDKKYRHANARSAKTTKRTKAFRKSAYYRNTWSDALKINKSGIRKDKKAMKFDQKKGYKRAVKYLQGKINYLNGYVREDNYKLSLAK